MQHLIIGLKSCSRASLLLAACSAALLSACGGDSSQAGLQSAPQLLASGVTTLQPDSGVLPASASVSALVAQPLFHVAPALLAAPDASDTYNNGGSAQRLPHRERLSGDLDRLSSRRLTLQAIWAARRQHADTAAAMASDGAAAPMAGSAVIATYTPAQIRAAYGLPALPAAGAALSAAQAAQLGAGQTIYIIDAMHDPNVAAELATFSQKFGLPGCTSRAIAVNAALPLPAAPANGCDFSVVYSTAANLIGGVAPAYDAGWATEITLDVQWAHATAPLARIILIEAPDGSINSLLAAVKLANLMGPGVVSMSFGAPEGNWTASLDAAFSQAGMTYLAATGDSGAAVSWPAVSPNVLAVSGTTLTYNGSAPRSETGWSDSGGGTSLYTPTPAYQSSAVPGMGAPAHRTVADVAFNADPTTGQYVAVLAPGATSASWLSAGGTSLSTPQWAGLIAVTNAIRALNAKPALGAPHAALYGQIASVPGDYASAFADITKGSNGTCATCSARVGYDPLSGLGTPNAASLLSLLSGAGTGATATAPVVNGAAIAGKAGAALSFTVSASAPNPLSYTLTGAPSGMTISGAGVVTWAAPVAGSYPLTVTARDSVTGLSGQGVYSVTISAQPIAAPVITPAAIAGKPGAPLSFVVSVSAANPVTYALSGAPAGMNISASGVIGWSSPVLGSYSVTVAARDSKTGLTGQALFTVKIAAAGPVISTTALSGVAGKPLSGMIGISDPGAASLKVSIAGAPLGMGFAMSGMNVAAAWQNPVAGSYSLTVLVQDAAGLSAQASVPIIVNAK